MENDSAAWATAVATIILAIVAVFQDLIRHFVRSKFSFLQPELKLELMKDPERSKTGRVREEDDPDVWYYYGKLQNKKRKGRAATQTQVFLIRQEEFDKGGYQVSWTKEVPIEWHLQRAKPLQLTIGPEQTFPICRIIKGVGVELQPIITPFAMKGKWEKPFKAVITFQAKSIEGDSNLLPVEIEWNGRWSDDREEIKRHLKVRELTQKDKAP